MCEFISTACQSFLVVAFKSLLWQKSLCHGITTKGPRSTTNDVSADHEITCGWNAMSLEFTKRKKNAWTIFFYAEKR